MKHSLVSFACLLLLLAACPVPAAELPGLVVPEGLGVNIHFTDPRPGEMEMLAEAGFRWVRMDFAWGGTEREKGKYDFSAYDRLLAALEQAQDPRPVHPRLLEPALRRRPVAGQRRGARRRSPAGPPPPRRHFRGRGILWEMYNEPNICFWKPKPDVEQYVKLALEVGKALREAAPGEMYIGPATSQIDLTFLEECFKAGLLEYWSAVSVHPYRQTAPETAAAEYARLRQLIDQYAPQGQDRSRSSPASGATRRPGRTSTTTKQGKMLPRQWLSNLANDVPLSIWYDWHDDGHDPKEPEHHFGTVRYPVPRRPRSGLRAQAGLPGRQDADDRARPAFTSTSGWRSAASDDYVLLFAKGDEVRLAAWTTAATPRTVLDPRQPGRFTVTGHTGEALPPLAGRRQGALGHSHRRPAVSSEDYPWTKVAVPSLILRGQPRPSGRAKIAIAHWRNPRPISSTSWTRREHSSTPIRLPRRASV